MLGENNKVVIVTGGSSGIGRCTASALKENGCIVYEFSRRNIPMEGVTHLSVDVTDEDAVNAAVQQVIQKETKIDVLSSDTLSFLIDLQQEQQQIRCTQNSSDNTHRISHCKEILSYQLRSQNQNHAYPC